jgi:hypothetical protein
MANAKLYFNTPLTRLFTTWNIYSQTSIQLTFKYWLFAVLIESRWGSEMFTSAPLRSRFKLYSDPGSLSNRIQSSYIFSGFPSEIIMPRMQFEYIISFWRLNIGQTITSRWARGANRYIEEKVRQVNSLDNGWNNKLVLDQWIRNYNPTRVDLHITRVSPWCFKIWCG